MTTLTRLWLWCRAVFQDNHLPLGKEPAVAGFFPTILLPFGEDLFSL